MGVFYHEEPPNHPKRCKYLAATLKEVFSQCRTFGGRLSTASLEDECPISDFEEQQEEVVSAVKSRAMERQKHKPGLTRDSFSWVYSPSTRELYITRTMATDEGVDDDDEREEFLSVKSCFSCRSSALSGEAFYSVKTNLSPCSSMNDLDLFDHNWRRSIIQQFCRCEGWPFGLCRKAVLLPPLPKSPSESWLWRKKQQSNTKE